MIILISGTSHTGKTLLAQKLLEKYHMPYLSIDHLKMGLIRSGQTTLTPMDDEELTAYLWPIVREMIKTAIENRQDLVVEGCYIPFNWRNDFTEEYLSDIRHICLVMTEHYIRTHFSDIVTFGSVIEARGEEELEMEWILEDNLQNLKLCRQHGIEPVLIDDNYCVDAVLEGIL